MIGLLRSLQRTAAPRPLEPSRIAIGEEVLDVVFRRHAQARRLVLRLNSTGTGVLVTVPKGVSRVKALEFTARSRGGSRSASGAAAGSFTSNPATCCRCAPSAMRSGTWKAARRGERRSRALHHRGSGRGCHVKRRLLDFLKAAAREELTRASSAMQR
jgi:predicted metal-dependent hydrolase